jgi:hypothetical protein
MIKSVKISFLNRFIYVGLRIQKRKEEMTMRWKACSTLLLAGALTVGSILPVYAEESVEPAGYHVYDVQEDEASDSWYGIARGAYLQAGVSKLTQEKTGYALCSGHTLAQVDCDRVYVRIYLDQSDDGSLGTGSWGTIDYWTGEAFDCSMVNAKSGSYKVTRNKYYRTTGVHSATKDGYTETTTTCTDALLFN